MSDPAQAQNKYDVAVIGGGSAGLCAAVAAARQGSRVVLIEKSDSLGGMGPLAFVHTFCGLYHPDTFKPPRVANRGLPEEIEAAMRERTGQKSATKMGRVYVLPQHPETYDQLARELVGAESDNLDLLLGSECQSISQSADGLFSISVSPGDGIRNIHATSLVDCTANAQLAKFLGVKRQRAELDHLQRPAFIFSLRGVGDEVKEDQFHMRLALDLVHAVREKRLPEQVLGTTIRHSVIAGECFVSLDLDCEGVTWNPSDPEALAEIKNKGEQIASELVEFLKQQYPFFANASAPTFPPSIGVRESYRWQGMHVLTKDELIGGEEFPDAVAYASWPMEMREDARGPKFTYLEKNESSAIPLRALASREIPGVYCAGRCISASHEALASVRVMGTCFATGQAAGIAASLYATGVHDIDQQADKIRQILD